MDLVEEEGDKAIKEEHESPNKNSMPLPSDPETRVSMLEEKIAKQNADFGTHRAKFKELYVQKEDELNKEKEAKVELEAKLKELLEELNETKRAVNIAEFMKANDIEMERQKFMHETKSQRINGEKYVQQIEKLRGDLHKAAKLRNEMEDDWSRIYSESQSKMSSLEVQVGTYEVVLLELNTSCQQTMERMDKRIKELAFERESTQRTIEKLETENCNLKGKHVAHSHQLQNESINMPNDVMALQEMVLRLKEELISVKIGKEQVEGELKFLKVQMQMVEEEKVGVEENLNSEISTIREQCLECKADNEKLREYKEKLEKRLNDLKSRLLASDAEIGKLNLLKKHNQDLIIEKEHLQSELQELHSRLNTLRKELTNSEELQKDLVSLSKSLQMSLEVIRQAETDVRWQHPDDITSCNTCRKPFLETQDKYHCKHCGRIFCTGCTSQTVKHGNRDYNVCEVCHTLLAHDSPPYFSTEAPHSPD